MSFSIGIIGLPNVGKSTLFKALTKQSVDISNYPFCTIDPNVGVVAVPDERLEKIAAVIKPKKVTPTAIEFVDIAGLVRKAHQGEGLGNQFLAQIREVDAICQVVRVFKNEKITHVEGQPDPKRDIEIINIELAMKDLETVDSHLEKVMKQAKSGDKKSIKELESLTKMKELLNQGKLLVSQPEIMANRSLIKELGLLTAKPVIYVFNTGQDPSTHSTSLRDYGLNEQKDYRLSEQSESKATVFDLKTEAELSELTAEEIQELELSSSQLDKLIKTCYQALDLITFYTVTGGQETRAWTLKKGLAIPQAGGVVHSDFEEKFIRAEIINWQRLTEAGNWTTAREKGLLRIEGKEYIVQDGDVIEFKI
jgi:GTP-binding protein YchF